jgi:hypothetical protein
MRSKPSSKPISSGLLRGPATTASGGRGSRPKALSMEWIYLSHRKSAPELYAKKSTTWYLNLCIGTKSLVNAFERVTLHVIQEIMKNQYSPSGPTLGSHKGELPFQTRPSLPHTFIALESHGALAYAIYKVGGDPVDYQFFNETPKEVPHGYTCTYIPDNSNPVRLIQ